MCFWRSGSSFFESSDTPGFERTRRSSVTTIAYASDGIGTESTAGSVGVGASDTDNDGSGDGLGGLSIGAGVIEAGGNGASDSAAAELHPTSRRHAPSASQNLRGKAGTS